MKRLIISSICTISIVYGCNDLEKTENKKVADEQRHSSPIPDKSELQHKESDSIELNNGAKWKIVDGMMEHIGHMEHDIKSFSAVNHKNLKEFLQLGAALQKNINLLISNCTMEGKAHDELHKWLLPYITLVDNLNMAKDIAEAGQISSEIETSFMIFNMHFESNK